MFDGCSYDLLKVEGGDWSFTGLPGADLRRASFRGVRLREADLTGARCAGVVLRDVDLSGAWTHKADFTGCDLRGSEISSIDPYTGELENARGLDVRHDYHLRTAAPPPGRCLALRNPRRASLPVHIANGAPSRGDAVASHVTPGYQACTSYPSDRVKPVSTRLPRLVARGYPAAVHGHLVRSTCLRLNRPVDKAPICKTSVPKGRTARGTAEVAGVPGVAPWP